MREQKEKKLSTEASSIMKSLLRRPSLQFDGALLYRLTVID
jgi:hypothetical protein